MNMRPDISDQLVHFTSGTDFEDAYGRLCSIIAQSCLIGGGEKIRGGYRCVCFSEAPLPSLQHGLVNLSAYSRYRPFGVIFDKAWVYAQGGRPVIYQSEADFEALPEHFRWRHVRYDPNGNPRIDFTWEREWRIQCAELLLDPTIAGIVVPDREWAERILRDHEEQQDFLVQEYSLIMNQSIAEQYRESFRWPVYVLR